MPNSIAYLTRSYSDVNECTHKGKKNIPRIFDTKHMHPNFTMPVAYIQQANLIFCVVRVRLISAGLRLVQSERKPTLSSDDKGVYFVTAGFPC